MKKILVLLLIATQTWAGLPPATTQGGNDASKVTTFNLHLPGRALTHVGTDAWVPTPQKSKEYIQNGDFEANSTTGWTLCNTTLTSGIPTGTITNTAASFNALSVTSSSPVAGTYSLSVSSPAATTAGQGFCSSTFTLDAEDSTISPRVQTIRASYSGLSNMNFSGTSSNTWAVYVYDVTNSQWIQPAGVYDFIGDGKLVATWQPNITSSQYKLVFLSVNASSGAIAMKWDSFSNGPQTAPIAPAMSDWTSFTPSFNAAWGTTTSVGGWYRQVGDSIDLYIAVTMGTGTASSGTISLPPGMTVDSTKLTFNSVPSAIVGLYGSDSTAPSGGSVLANGGDLTHLYIGGGFSGAGASGSDRFISMSSFQATSAFVIQVNHLPIAGKSSNTVSSADTDTRVVAMQAFGTVPITTANTPLKWGSVSRDTHAAYNASTGQYTAPVTGYYQVYASTQAGQAAGNGIYVSVNGATAAGANGPFLGFTPATSFPTTGSGIVYATVGQTIDVRPTSATGAGAANDTLQITRVSGPAVVTATESVNFHASNTAGTSIGASFAAVPFATVDWDSHNKWVTNAYTIPVSGKYHVNASLAINGTGGTKADIKIIQSGSRSQSSIVQELVSGNVVSLPISDDFYCMAGDTLQIQAFSDMTGPVLITSAGYNFLSISRIGN